MYTYMHIYAYMYIHTCIHMYIHIYTYMLYIHIYTYMYMYTYMSNIIKIIYVIHKVCAYNGLSSLPIHHFQKKIKKNRNKCLAGLE